MKDSSLLSERVGGPPLTGPVRRLVLRAPNWIGDAVMCEPAVRRVRGCFPDAEITLLARPAVVELFGSHPALDRAITYQHRGRHAGWAGKWTLAGELRRERFDLAILFQNAFEAAVLAFLAGIPMRYGYATDGRGWLLTAGRRTPGRDVHHVRYYLELLDRFGAVPEAATPQLFVTPDEEAAMTRRLSEAGIDRGARLIGLNPGSVYGGAKRWLPERFAETADRLAARHEARVLIVGAPGEEALGRAIAAQMRTRPVVLSGETTIRELMAACKRCALFLTNDTGPMHVAAAFGVPVVAVFGPTDAAATSPSGASHVLVRQPVDCSPCLLRECPIDHRCMTGVTVDMVAAAAERLLEADKLTGEQADMFGSPDLSACQPANLPASLDGVTVFLDRDGTVNRDTGYVKHADDLAVLPGVPGAIARLNRAGARVVLVTNQSGIARGYLTLDGLKDIHSRLRDVLMADGARLDAIYFCPHHPEEGCGCRKPKPGMVERAAADLGLGPGRRYVVGDQLRDVELARAIGARAVVVLTGQTSRDAAAAAGDAAPDHVADDLTDAVDWILSDAASQFKIKN
jgi:heptosyltransferase-2